MKNLKDYLVNESYEMSNDAQYCIYEFVGLLLDPKPHDQFVNKKQFDVMHKYADKYLDDNTKKVFQEYKDGDLNDFVYDKKALTALVQALGFYLYKYDDKGTEYVFNKLCDILKEDPEDLIKYYAI